MNELGHNNYDHLNNIVFFTNNFGHRLIESLQTNYKKLLDIKGKFIKSLFYCITKRYIYIYILSKKKIIILLLPHSYYPRMSHIFLYSIMYTLGN